LQAVLASLGSLFQSFARLPTGFERENHVFEGLGAHTKSEFDFF
jgi:hypothetical protein